MKLRLDDLQYATFPGGRPDSQWLSLHCEAFRCWREVWSETLQELDGNGQIFSDDYERQSEIGVLMLNNRCVALGLFHQVDFRLPTARLDSYFKVWPDSAIQKLLEDGTDVLIGSNITVDKEFRGDLGSGLHLKTLISGLMVRTFLDRPVDVMTGTMRCNRGMQSEAHQLGGASIASGIMHHGVEVELVAFYRRRILQAGILQSYLPIEILWRNRKEYLMGQDILAKTPGRRSAG